MRKFFSFVLLGFFTSLLTAQEISYPVNTIDDSLLENANAILRNEEIEIEILAIDKMVVKKSRTITVLNELGEKLIWAGDIYDNDTKIKNQHVVFLDEWGKELKKFKKRDFQDRSFVRGSTLISDSRVSFIDYSPKVYPFTVIYTSEIRAGSTIFLEDWLPSASYSLSVERSTYKLKNPAKIPIRFSERNFSSHNIKKINSEHELEYVIEGFPAYKFENFSPDLKNFVPSVKVALNQFSLMGVNGEAQNWEQLGKWQYDNLLKNKLELPESTISEITNLTSNASDIREKIQLIYNYVQTNTRYVSVQLGIGGWEPMSAIEVDQLKYGDCKALTNYTRALLNSQDISSNYAVVYGGSDLKDVDENFASMEGNHVILQVPLEQEHIWLECTSQTTPFNYIAGFTDDRKVLVVKEEGGEIIKTKSYSTLENLRKTKAIIKVLEMGGYEVEISRESFGTPYGMIYSIANNDVESKELYYKKEFSHLRNFQIEEIIYSNDRLIPKFSEVIKFTGEKYATVIGNQLLLPLGFMRLPTLNLPRSSDRKLPVKIERGLTVRDKYEFHLPKNLSPESIPENVYMTNEFGSFRLDITYDELQGFPRFLIESEYILKEGLWPSEKYSQLRKFFNTVKSSSNPKAILVKT